MSLDVLFMIFPSFEFPIMNVPVPWEFSAHRAFLLEKWPGDELQQGQQPDQALLLQSQQTEHFAELITFHAEALQTKTSAEETSVNDGFHCTNRLLQIQQFWVFPVTKSGLCKNTSLLRLSIGKRTLNKKSYKKCIKI